MTKAFSGLIEGVSLHDKTTYRIGGKAHYYAAPQSDEEICAVGNWSKEHGVPLFVLGKGSNLLVSDYGWPGLVLHIDGGDTVATLQWDKRSVTAPGGISLNDLVKSAADNGFSGMEELAGIPGTVGGGVIMNAGAFSQCIADTLVSVTCWMQEDGSVCTIAASDLLLGYRTSVLKGTGSIVLSAQFTFSKTDTPEMVNERRREILERRKAKQPLDYPNCGSVFKRPPGNYAGTLIEKCGLKGFTIGGAQVSEKHANFIINKGNARAEEVRSLIATIQKRVYEESGILLEPEVIFVGAFDNNLYTPPERT